MRAWGDPDSSLAAVAPDSSSIAISVAPDLAALESDETAERDGGPHRDVALICWTVQNGVYKMSTVL